MLFNNFIVKFLNMSRQSLSEWCIKNSKTTIWIGVGAIFAGVIIGCVTELFHHEILPVWRVILTILWHALVIFGEALAVVFFLHYFVEKQTHEHNQKVMTDRFDGLITTFENNSNEKIKQIQHNLFKAILQGANIMPVEIIDFIKKANYNTKLIRSDLELVYFFDKTDGDKIIIKQEMTFRLKNNSENDSEAEKFAMPLRLNDSPFVSYDFMEASYTPIDADGEPRGKKNKFTKSNFKDKDNASETSDITLGEYIEIKSGEQIEVYQYIKTIFNFGVNETVSDYYHSMMYTTKITIKAMHFPPEYDFELIPTGPNKNIKFDTAGDNKIFELPFFLPGQGFYYTIQKKSTK